MDDHKILEQAREAFRKEAWGDAYIQFSALDARITLGADDLEQMAIAAYLTGKFTESSDAWSRAHTGYLSRGNITCAVRCAFWLGFTLLNKGESARGGGWIGRARSLLDEQSPDCVEQGYLMLPVALQRLGQGDAEGAVETFVEVGRIANRFQDPDLSTLTRLGIGQALIRCGEVVKGVSLLDEAMANIESGSHSPIVVGIVYCAVIETCLEIFDLSRAKEWTEALSDWCAAHPHLVPFRGQCLTRRSEILKIHGEWTHAVREVNHAIEILSSPKGEPAAGAAFYQLGELYRLQGMFLKAEEAYGEAHKWGRKPQPGMALLRLYQGEIENAISSITHALKETKNPRNRSGILVAYIEIMLSAGEVQKARDALSDLKEISHEINAQYIHSQVFYAEGGVLLAEGEPQKALDMLQNAKNTWERLKVPYEVARTQCLIGKACFETGDPDTGLLELRTARWTFQQLKAIPDLTEVDSLMQTKKAGKSNPLSPREQ